jgi:hypothetical protein
LKTFSEDRCPAAAPRDLTDKHWPVEYVGHRLRVGVLNESTCARCGLPIWRTPDSLSWRSVTFVIAEEPF